jgi:hypothetical protein
MKIINVFVELDENFEAEKWNPETKRMENIKMSITSRIINVYDKGITSPYEVGVMLAEAGLRDMPEKLEKSTLNEWHKPKRVDAVIKDSFFELMVEPPPVQCELKRNIDLYKEHGDQRI